MNRITQCIHGRGTVSAIMQHRDRPSREVPSRYLAFAGIRRPVVFWNITNRCNLGCEHCYSRSGPNSHAGDELDTDEAFDLIDDLAGMGVPLVLFSGGEPLMRGDIWDLAEHAGEKGIKTALSTNGTLITREVAEKIRDSGIEYAGISLHGARATNHDRFRNSPGAIDRTIAGFARCREAGVRCGVRITLTNENSHELADLIDLSLAMGASRFCLYWMVPCGRGTDSYHRLQVGNTVVEDALGLLFRKAQEIDPSTMEFLTVDAPQDCIHLIQSMERDGSPDLSEAKTLLASLNGGCSAGDRVANIDPYGNVYPCQFARAPAFLVGNIRERPFSVMWAEETHPVLHQFRGKKALISGRCRECRYFTLCGGGCRVRAYAETGDISAPDPFCFVE